jgi:integrase/recombinase XerC
MLDRQIKGFIEYCKACGFKERSIQAFTIRLNDFNKFLKVKRLSRIRSITYSYLTAFVADFKDPSIHVKKSRIWALRQFFHYLKLNGIVRENIATNLPYPKIEKTVPHFLTIDEYNRILHYFTARINMAQGLRNLIIIMMMGILGIRTGTIIALNVQNIDLISGLAWVKEKGARKRIMVLPEMICSLLQKHLEQMGRSKGPVFLSKRGKRISPRTLQDMFRSAADNLSIHKHLHAHLFRHTAATHLNRVAGTTITQHVLGHARRQNTYKYTHLNPDYYAGYVKKHPFMKL